MVGYAATATIVARGKPGADWAGAGNDALYAHVRTVPAPRIVVVADLDDPPAHGALWGEVHATIFSALGALGARHRRLRPRPRRGAAIGFHFFAAAVGGLARLRTGRDGRRAGRDRRPADRPGDLLHADQHGVLRIPHEIAAELPRAADRVIEREQALLRWVRSPDFDPERLAEMRAVHHAASGFERLPPS